MSIEEYRKQVDERGCGCRQCRPPIKKDTRHAHLMKNVMSRKDYWRRKNEIAEYNEMVERVLKATFKEFEQKKAAQLERRWADE